MSLPKHPQYKATESKLVAEVPKDWQLLPLRRLLPVIESGTSVNALDNQPEKGKPSVLKTSCVYTSRFRPEECKEIVEEELERATCPVKKDSLIVSRMNTPDLVGAAGLADSDKGHLYLPDRLWQVRIRGLLPAFAYYWTQSKLYRDQVKAACSGTSSSMQNLSQEAFVSFFLCRPESGEQNQIANFLDRETAKIDALIAEQQRLIELLQEKRQVVISHAVTKGLNPNAPMKDSGVEWLGKVPEHWGIKRLKHVSPQLTVGIVVNPSSYVVEDGLPFIYGGDIREGFINWEEARRITPDKSEEQPKTRLSEGDLVVVRVGAPGVTAVVPAECDGGNCASVMLIRRGDYSSQWLCYLMNTRIVRFQVEVVQYGAAQEQFNIGHAVNFWVPVPPREEQEHIVNKLDIESNKASRLITEAEQSVELLRERRSALISAAVTGQIDVRGLVPEDAEQ